jgi:hypothetical protein
MKAGENVKDKYGNLFLIIVNRKKTHGYYLAIKVVDTYYKLYHYYNTLDFYAEPVDNVSIEIIEEKYKKGDVLRYESGSFYLTVIYIKKIDNYTFEGLLIDCSLLAINPDLYEKKNYSTNEFKLYK